MKKNYYIPTSTLNFNNILSSESISPKAFYDKRGFGYTRWTTIPENPFENAIALYDKLCYFERPKSDLEDHPLLIEVCLEENRLKQGDGYYYCDSTIYLTPTTSRLLFFTKQDGIVALSMSENSYETKLMRLYKNQTKVIDMPTERYRMIGVDEPCVLNEAELERDRRTNKMKGMLYGYYIGALLSTDPESIRYLNVLREIHNIFAAVLSSFDQKPTVYQSQRLDELFDVINEKDPHYQELTYGIIGDVTIAKKVLQWFQLRFGLTMGFEHKEKYLQFLQTKSGTQEEENYSIKWIKGKIEDEKRQIKCKSVLLQPDQGELVVINNSVSSLKNDNIKNDIENKLCLAWLNETLASKETNGKISSYREELAKNVTLKAKEVYQNNWEGSFTRAYLNGLRRHIAGEQFDYEWNNGLLSSIASVIIAGDDWEKLLLYMQNKGMTEYKLPFAFYGILNGFANLSRDFTDLLFAQKGDYVREVYKEFFGQLFEEPMSFVVAESQEYNVQKLVVEDKPYDKITVESIIKQLKKSKCGINDGDIRKVAELYFKLRDKPKVFLYEIKRIKGIGAKKIDRIAGALDVAPIVEHDLFDEGSFILQLDCVRDLEPGKIEQLKYWWKVAVDQHPGDKEEVIRHFINLCKKEGRGESSSSYQALKGYFTQEVAGQFEAELKRRYNNQK